MCETGTILVDQKIHYCSTINSPKIDLQIQHTSNENPNRNSVEIHINSKNFCGSKKPKAIQNNSQKEKY